MPDFATLKPVGNPIGTGQPDFATLKSSDGSPPPEYNPVADKNVSIADRAGIYFGGLAKQIGGALFSSEKGVGETIGQSNAVNSQDFTNAQTSHQELQDMIFKAGKQIQADRAQGKDTSRLEALVNHAQGATNAFDINKIAPATQKTDAQALAEVAGVGLDLLSGGTYGETTKAMTTGKLFTTADKEAAQAISQSIAKNIEGLPANSGLVQTLKAIGIKTAQHAVTGGAVGYASDVTQNLQSGKTGAEAFTPGLGTATGLILPTTIGGVRAGVAVGREEAPRFINSLIRPSNANFAYGKNPGRTVSELGITGNSLSDFEKNISTAKQDVGQKIGAVYQNPANAKVRINAEDDIAKIDTAIKDAAKGGKNNQGIATQLQNIKDAILYEHGFVEGEVTKTGTTPRNLTDLTAQESQDLIQHVADQTQFTGRPSDDKTVNSVLKDIYAGIREKITSAVSPNTPEITKLNQQYGDLVSAELAVRHRIPAVNRLNMIGAKATGLGAVSGAVAAILTGGAAIPIALAGLGAAGVEKAFETTAVKTRVAKWLATATPQAVKEFSIKNPQVIPILLRAFPNYAGKINQPNPR